MYAVLCSRRMGQHPSDRAFGQRGILARLFAACVGVLCLLAQFSAALHLVLVEHAHCAQHGEWVHVDGEHGGHAVHAVDAAHTGVSSQAVTGTADEQGHDHDHCLVGSERRKLALLPPPQPELRAPDGAEEPAHLGRTVLAPSTHRYFFAPKTSPPV